ncbi:MAG: O-antigen ligase family protein [Patescibacteria group bacterium]
MLISVLAALAAILIIAVFIARPNFSLYALAFLIPAIGWYFYVGPLVIPLTDLAALLALIAFAVRSIYTLLFEPRRRLALKWPLLFPFFIFLGISLLSSLLSDNIWSSLWYVVRWPLLLYLAYIFLPYNLIRNGPILKRTIIALALGCFLVTANGYLSLYGQDWHDSFFRIRPMAWFGIYLFGDNHNLIAEFLNVGAFLIMTWRFLVKSSRLRRSLDIAFILTALAIVLTFSRAGWITLALQIAVYGWFYFRAKNYSTVNLALAGIALLIMLSPLLWKMEKLQRDNASSTENRWLLTEIAWQAYDRKPYLGYGSGEFVNLVDENIRFRAKYGLAIDSHGVLQKVLAENGIFGLAAWLFIMSALWQTSYRAIKKYYEHHPWLLPLLLAGAGGLFFQLFNTSYYKGKVWLPIAIGLAAIRLLDVKYGRKETTQN